MDYGQRIDDSDGRGSDGCDSAGNHNRQTETYGFGEAHHGEKII